MGAATPRCQQQVGDSWSRGKKPLPRRPWERQRRDASAKSTNSLSRGDAPPTTPTAGHREPQSGRCPLPSRPWERQRRDASAKSTNSLSRGDAPPTTAAGHREPQSGRCPFPSRPWERQRRDASAKSTDSLSRGGAPPTTAAGHREPQSGRCPSHDSSRSSRASVGAVPLPRRQQQVIESLSRGDAPSQVARGSGNAATQAPSQQTASVGAMPLPRQQQVIESLSRGDAPPTTPAASRGMLCGAGRSATLATLEILAPALTACRRSI